MVNNATQKDMIEMWLKIGMVLVKAYLALDLDGMYEADFEINEV